MADERSGGTAKRDLTCLLWVLGAFGCLGVGVLALLFGVAYNNATTFNCKSIQSEAKTNLSGLFTAQKAFFGEYNSYSSDLVAVNWMPDGSPKYLYGFAGPSHENEANLKKWIPGYDPNRTSTDHPMVIGSPPRYSVQKMGGLTRGQLPMNAMVGSTTFVAAAVGNIDGDSTLDVWTIDNVKSLNVVVNDCIQ
jgi:type IV pilus assembly protein PilA